MIRFPVSEQNFLGWQLIQIYNEKEAVKAFYPLANSIILCFIDVRLAVESEQFHFTWNRESGLQHSALQSSLTVQRSNFL